jgi:hypothetical protein
MSQVELGSDWLIVRTIVIAELSKPSYPGVVCSHCGATIPVTGKAARLYENIKSSELLDNESQTRSFPKRCGACEEEGVYAITEIHEFEGRPISRRAKTSSSTKSALDPSS